ncbi:hypothetical protein PVAP13_6KG199100 [Panicum virgatum]|uniref:Uncharacterized protein n=1 Tax=Panicum virgatum TaxID=38727 RepID=A0A8T0R9V4_PANVG|nr:hypothetical protein PVAP13_6KG199100 [Panicum virgatum]
MEASNTPIEVTSSRSAPQTARGRHVFEIAGYSLQKDGDLGVGKFIKSAAFAVGGHYWRIRFYPDVLVGEDKEYVAVFLERISETAEVVAIVKKPRVFTTLQPTWGFQKFMKKSELEGRPFLLRDRLVLECCVTVIMGAPVSESRTLCIQVPPSDLVDNLGKLLESEEGADVTFKVEDKVFHAHKIVLAMRSPVFKAELYGPMRDMNQPSITVQDMQPAVFKALLHFIYKDSLPVMDNLDEDENKEMVKHLLEVADRYALERMKLMCENILCRKLDAGSVAAVLALADQHHCSLLKEACIQFINSSTKMDDLVASHGYAHLKRACPTVFADIWERSAKFC